MKTNRRALTGVVVAALLGWGLARPAPVAGHCDSMDGPVVKAARAALDQEAVELVLPWVLPRDEGRIRDAFARTMVVRKAGGEAEALADLWFFETLVRIHREGEGEPYTGLKPAGQEPGPGIAAADRALEAGTADELAPDIAEHVADAVRERFERVRTLARYDVSDVVAARAYVHAYVEYVHFVERVAEAVESHAGRAQGSPHADGAVVPEDAYLCVHGQAPCR